jgi:hypothetical protein
MNDQNFNQHGTETAVVESPAPDATKQAGDEAPFANTIPMNTPRTSEVPGTNGESTEALLDPAVTEHFRSRWNEIQNKFVDGPRSSVQQADALVAELIGQITRTFSSDLAELEEQWNQDRDISTEDLRKALQRYRSFFNRLIV